MRRGFVYSYQRDQNNPVTLLFFIDLKNGTLIPPDAGLLTTGSLRIHLCRNCRIHPFSLRGKLADDTFIQLDLIDKAEPLYRITYRIFK